MAENEGLYGSSFESNVSRVVAAEIAGTFFLVFVGTAVAVAAVGGAPLVGAGSNYLAIALGFGLTLASLVTALGHVSGAHFNPAVTIGLAGTGRFPLKYVPYYLASQIIGAILAALAVWAAFGSTLKRSTHLGAALPQYGAGSLRVLFMEAVITFLLVLVIVAVATDKRVPRAAAATAVGFALASAVLAGLSVSGGSANPARALGPMIVSHTFNSWWAYILGPIVGGYVAAIVYNRFLAEAEEPEET